MKTIASFCLFILIGALLQTSARDFSLALGSTTTGTITQPGAFDRYTFTGMAGQRVLYDALEADFDQIAVRLVNPSGATVHINGNADSDIGPFTLADTGTYALVIDGVGATVGDYKFRLLDMVGQPTVILDTPVSKTLDPGFSADMYSFVGGAGQRLFFDAMGANTSGSWALFGPNNELLGNAGMTSDFELTLNQPGRNILILSGNNASPVPYSFTVVTFEATTNQLTFDEAVSGAISEPGEQQLYTFEGAPGQRLVYDALEGDFDQMAARLINPSGATAHINGNADTDVGPFALSETGTYTLVIDGQGATVGDFMFRLLRVSNLPPLPLDAVITKTLNPGFSIDGYQFNGTAGQKLYFDGLGANTGGSWYLFGPNNESLGSSGVGGDFEVILSQPGTYVVGVAGNSPNPVPYSFQVVTFDTPSLPLTLGGTVGGNITEPGEQRTYTFVGTVGQRIYYDALDRDFENIGCRLLSSSGAVIWDINHSSDNGPVLLLEAGTYRLVIDGSGATTGDYNFRMLDLAMASVLSLTVTTSGQLSPASATEAHRFNGTLGQRINLDSISSALGQASWRLVGPANLTLVSGGLTSDLGDVVLPVAGPHWVLVEGGAENVVPLSYQFRASDRSDTMVLVSGLGDVRSGNIAAGQQDTNRFTAPAGLWVYFDSQDRSSGGNLYAELRDPSGNVVFTVSAASDAGPYVLPRSGEYNLVIRGTSPAGTGSYRFRLLDLANGAPQLSLDTTIMSTLDPSYRTDVHQFTGTSGQRLVYDALENDFDSIAVRLLAPDGTIRHLNGNADSDVGPFTLIIGGTYYLIVESNLPNPADYNFRLLNVESQPVLQLRVQVNQMIDPGLGIVLFRFAGASGQHLFLDGLASSSGGSWFLYGPNNESLGGSGLNGDIEVTLQQAGTYVLALSGNSANPVMASFYVYTPEEAGGPEILSINVSAAAATIVWTATAGKMYRLQHKATLNQANWSNLAGDVTASGTTTSKVDSSIGSANQRFYRVEELE